MAEHSTRRMFGLWLAVVVSSALACDQVLENLPLPGLQKTQPDQALELNGLVARATDRFGETLRLEIQGQDGAGQVIGAELTLLDASGQQVLCFDSDWDGQADSGVNVRGFDTDIRGQQDFNVVITLEKILGQHPEIQQIKLRLLNAAQDLSNSMQADVSSQSVRSEDESCDPSLIVDRCELGLGCRGEPSVCVPGVAPEVTEFAYLDAPEGARILVAGQDLDADVKLVAIGFFDASGDPVAVDLNNDGIIEETVFEVAVNDLRDDGTFLVRLDPTAEFVEIVRQLSVRPLDWSGQWGEEVNTQFSPPVYRSGSAVCDPRGFDQCVAGTVCYPGDVEAEQNRCQVIQSLRVDVCDRAQSSDAQVILAGASGQLKVQGLAQGLSLWEPPTDCTGQVSRGQPEALLVLHLEQEIAHLRLSTDNSETHFDTIVYVLPGCFAGVEQTLVCDDDDPDSFTSTVELTDLSAGDYFVVVDSWGESGGTFALDIQFE